MSRPTTGEQASSPVLEVRLLGVPLLVRERSQQHGADLLRELELVRIGQQEGVTEHEAPRRLLELVEELQVTYTPYVAASVEAMDTALDAGQDVLDEVVYRLPPGSDAFVARLADRLAEVEEYCRSGEHLLTLAPPPDVAAYRRWTTEEVRRQAAGEPPTSWPDFAAAHGLRPDGTPAG